METTIPLLFAAMVGFTHAFEVDHLVAVSSMVTRRNSIKASIKDGIYWGLGHTSTILAVGLLMIVAKVAVAEATFGYFETAVGLMLILLGAHRIWKTWKHEQHHHEAHHGEALHHHHHLAYGIGLVHRTKEQFARHCLPVDFWVGFHRRYATCFRRIQFAVFQEIYQCPASPRSTYTRIIAVVYCPGLQSYVGKS